MLTDHTQGVISDLNELTVVGHRVVLGGDKYSNAVIINKEVVEDIDKNSNLAPLHNPLNSMVIKEAIKQRNFQPIAMKVDGRINIQAKDPYSGGKKPKALQKASQVQTQQATPQAVQQPQQVMPQLQPRVAYRMPQYQMMPNAYYLQPQVPPMPPVMPQGYYPQQYGVYANPTSYVR